MIKQKLQSMTGKKHIFITKSGDHSILYALKLVNSLNKEVLLQDQGGWITYSQYCKKLKISFKELKTDFGLILPETLEDNKVLLTNSMPGYYILQDMRRLQDVCKKKNILLINDASGSIGHQEAYYGDIILGSFGKEKPINLLEGGFLATDNEAYASFFSQFEEYVLDEKKFLAEVSHLNEKISSWTSLKEKIKEDLKAYNILKPEAKGINLIILFKDEHEKERLIKYCDQSSLEYELCPRQIRVLVKAVCIELKRKQ
jgi:dTDP-4-amino-4,6-dideoxygalactose transaminase